MIPKRILGLTALYAFVGFILTGLPLHAQGLDYIKTHYTKTEHQIPMRDGARLYMAVYAPKDTSRKYPILLTRTQSGIEPYGVDKYHPTLGPSSLFGKEGYIFVYQDIRGRWMSEGTFVRMRPHNPMKGRKDVDESSDTYDTIDWLLKNVPNHSGKVGHYGTSYRGWLVAAGMIEAHPAMVAASPQAPVIDTFAGDDWHHNGATFLSHAFFYAHRVGTFRPSPVKEPFYTKPNYDTPDGYDFFLRLGSLANIDAKHFKGQNQLWNDLMSHPTYDVVWQSRNLRPHLKNIKPALLTVGGWFDAENLFGTLAAHGCFERDRANNVLVMGPWIHGGWNGGTGASLGPVSFGSKTAEFYREKVELPFFNFYLKEKGDLKLPKALVFETGTNQWRQYASWPPKATKPIWLYLHPGGRLAYEPPTAPAKDEQGAGNAFDEYLSDPAKPVPYIDKIGTRMIPEYICADQRFASRRPDVLVYESDVLARPLTLAGPITADLHVSTTGTDSDWIVKLIDVYPDDYPDLILPSPSGRGAGDEGVRMGGYQQLVRGEVMRGRFRNSLEKPEAMEPGRPTAVRFKLPDVCHTFRPGHKIMVQVHSSWFPLVERNPQAFVDIAHAKDSDFRKATQRVYRAKEMPSRLLVQTLP